MKSIDGGDCKISSNCTVEAGDLGTATVYLSDTASFIMNAGAKMEDNYSAGSTIYINTGSCYECKIQGSLIRNKAGNAENINISGKWTDASDTEHDGTSTDIENGFLI